MFALISLFDRDKDLQLFITLQFDNNTSKQSFVQFSKSLILDSLIPLLSINNV